MTHTKARRHEVKNGKNEGFKPFVPSCLRVRSSRIASCLSSLAPLIAAETQKLEALKKGLTQQLFPSLEEV